MADEFLPPLEIPWTLAATTQPLAPFEPADNAISLFWYLPDDKELTSEYPNDRLVYLKSWSRCRQRRCLRAFRSPRDSRSATEFRASIYDSTSRSARPAVGPARRVPTFMPQPP